jgi:hypothetical protein
MVSAGLESADAQSSGQPLANCCHLRTTVRLSCQEGCNRLMNDGEGWNMVLFTPCSEQSKIRSVRAPRGDRLLGAGVACRIPELGAERSRLSASIRYGKTPRRGVIGSHFLPVTARGLFLYRFFR